MITCKSCKQTLDRNNFYRSTRTNSGYRGVCKKCCSSQAKARYDKNKTFVGHNQSNLPMPSQSDLVDMFDYHPDGGFIRKVARGTQKIGGLVVGKLEKNGYRRIPINYNLYVAHRLIWKWHHGTEPEFIDHINHDRSDNRIENLRPVSKNQNSQHQVLPVNNTSGFYGIRWHEYGGNVGCWVVSISHYGEKTSKRRDSIEQAVEVYEKLATKHHGEFAVDKIAHNRKTLESM